MTHFNIRDKCRVNTNFGDDTFVGIRCENNTITINFPLGYAISKDDKGLRKDILLLIDTIRKTTKRKDSNIVNEVKEYNKTAFPIQAYIAVINDFYVRGYFKEKQIIYSKAKRGKIDWNRTIKTQKSYIQDGNPYYLDFITKKNSNNDNMITFIHEFCVYESFLQVGWLFCGVIPQKPRIKYNEKLFKSILKDKITNTFNDKDKLLFINMLTIVNYYGDTDSKCNYEYGTYRFEYVWEKIIDNVFGISNKKDYFPNTTWMLYSDKYENNLLEPDTIMTYNNNVYILDAKYYKYGVTRKVADLPNSASINKQITYGEYVDTQERFKKIHGYNMKVFNAFIMPFDFVKSRYLGDSHMVKIGYGISHWKNNVKDYEKIQGILIDVKMLMSINIKNDEKRIMKLAELIETNI